MKREPKTITRKVTLLTDPEPQFNSIVRSGANGTPLRVIKSDELNQEADVPKNLKNGNADIARLTFRGDNFKTVEQVQAWLDAGNYVETVIKTEEDGSFTVEGNDALVNVQPIDVEDGVVSFVGEAAETAKDDDDTANADVTAIEGKKSETPKTGAQKDEDELRAKAEEKVRTEAGLSEADWAGLQQETRDKFTAPVLEAMKAELQPVATDAPAEPAKVTGEEPPKPSDELPTLLAKSETGLISIVAQKGCYELENLAEIIRSLSWLKESYEYDAYTGNASPEVAASLRTAIKTLGEILIQVASAHVEQASKTEDAPAPTTEQAAGETQENEVKAAKAAETEPTAPEASTSEPVADPVVTALQALTDTVAGLQKQLSEANERAEQSAKKAETLAERLEKVESTSQTRKSADVEDMPRVSPIHSDSKAVSQKSAEEISKEVRHRNSLEAMGIRT
ncbi:hypothetical protein J2J97_31750 (plasmid) [Rhizobium bangladeshense]|uniref:hypothetical protein n=1 Tax=Rhizobium bangladeshense TaxID=1138189 RepID=UPI001A9979A2|nr:hypothetical protein [Rhizobium bangladeshense]QSY98646.1 hypothetical protein J2J97_31750 [Rhizobium bangladeshense]